jgi:DNA-binding XRE family transcriptional regulator
MSTVAPGGEGSLPEGAEATLAAARQEAATLRSIFDAISDAMLAAVARLEALEAQLGVGAPPDEPRPVPAAPGGHSGRHGAEWKLPGWSSAAGGSGDVVTGETIRARREALAISQAAVAHAAHCSRGLVAEVERGKRRSAQTLAHLASVLDRLEQQARRN